MKRKLGFISPQLLIILLVIAGGIYLAVNSSGGSFLSWSRSLIPPEPVSVTFQGETFSGVLIKEMSSGTSSSFGEATASATETDGLSMRSSAGSSSGVSGITIMGSAELQSDKDISKVDQIDLTIRGSHRVEIAHPVEKGSSLFAIHIVDKNKEHELLAYAVSVPENMAVTKSGSFGNIVLIRRNNTFSVKSMSEIRGFTNGNPTTKATVDTSGPVYLKLISLSSVDGGRGGTSTQSTTLTNIDYIEPAPEQPLVVAQEPQPAVTVTATASPVATGGATTTSENVATVSEKQEEIGGIITPTASKESFFDKIINFFRNLFGWNQ